MSQADRDHGTTPAQKILLIGFGVLLVILFEGALRLAGVGGETALFLRRPGPDGQEVFVNNEALNRRLFFPVTGRSSNFPRPQIPYARFAARKDPDTFRFFTVGASSSVAFPYTPNVAFASFLREMLAAGMPDRNVESINVSMTAVSSYQVSRWVAEILRLYDPDLIVVYTGHNEFYGVLGAGSSMSVGRNRTLTRLFQRLQETAVYALVAGAVERVRRPPEESALAQPIEAMTRDREIRFDGELHRSVERNFEANLEGMARAAERRGVPIVFCTPVSNRVDCSPMGPIHREDFPAGEAHRWDRYLSTGDSYLRLGDAGGAAAEYRNAIALDDRHAGAEYRLGRAEMLGGEREEAAAAFDRALLLDGVRLRASDPIVETVRRVCRRHEAGGAVRPADTVARFNDESPAGRPGANLVLEHIHMNGRGHWLAASQIYRTLLRSGLAGPLDPAGELPFEEAAARVGYGDVDHAYGLAFTRIMLERWPFQGTWRNEERMRETQHELDRVMERMDPLEREIFEADGARVPLAQIIHRIGLAGLERGEASLAAKRFDLLAGLFPFTPEVRILQSRALLADDRPEEAAAAAREAVFYAPDRGEARLILAEALLRAGDAEGARKTIDDAVRLGALDADTVRTIRTLTPLLEN
ncbi:MAG: tetratricopeptide repeat protein [Candidatus Eisenbacteria bacterium]|nr:tetratricopeptide repeat protein [Candidatus Eisenbacteria bacterium]